MASIGGEWYRIARRGESGPRHPLVGQETRCLRAVAADRLERQEAYVAGSAAWLTLAEDWEGSAAGGKQAGASVPRREPLRCGVVLLAVGSV